MNYKFYFPFRVRYAETDAQGIVFNGNHLTYFDTAIYEYFRCLPFDFVEHVNLTRSDFHTVRVAVDFIAPARFDQIIHAGIRVQKIGKSSLIFDVGIFSTNKANLLVKGEVIWVNVDQNTQCSSPLPDELIRLINKLEETL